MEKVNKRQDLRMMTDNRVGILTEITDLIAESEINIENLCVYSIDDKAVFYFMTSDHAKTKKVLEEMGYTVEEREVIVLELWNRPGVLSKIAILFKENGINLLTVYGTTSPGGERTTIVFCADDNEKASEIFDNMVLEELL